MFFVAFNATDHATLDFKGWQVISDAFGSARDKFTNCDSHLQHHSSLRLWQRIEFAIH
jgi:hypothetical protein